MQKLFQFEITLATKDRSRLFQIFTLTLLAFSMTVILVSLLYSVTGKQRGRHESRPGEGSFAKFATATPRLLQLQK